MTLDVRTLSRRAYDEIRAAILSRRLGPGTKVVVRPLAEELGLSPTPIKVALTALEREGFLTSVPHRGFFVPIITRDDMREIYELREVIDGIAARNAAKSADTTALVEDLETLLEQQRFFSDSGELSQYSDLDLCFHQTIWRAAGNRRLAQVAENLLGQVRAGSGGSSQVPGRLATALMEHSAILEALASGDAVRAEKLAREHVRTAGAALDTYLTGMDGDAAQAD